jgi:hypothetical protein
LVNGDGTYESVVDSFEGKTLNIINNIDLSSYKDTPILQYQTGWEFDGISGEYVFVGRRVPIGIGWTPIGTDLNMRNQITWEYTYFGGFRGSIRGNNFTISNLMIELDSGFYVENIGFIGYSDVKITISNLNFNNININIYSGNDGGWGIGSLIGQGNRLWNEDQYLGPSLLSNCHIKGNIKGDELDNCSGLIGLAIDYSIDNCSFEGEIIAKEGWYIGGLAGRVYPSKSSNLIMNNSFASGKINIYLNSGGIGGLAGMCDEMELTHCYYAGTIMGSRYEIGGLCGDCYDSILTNCKFLGILNLINSSRWISDVGGIVGYSSGLLIKDCFVIANIRTVGGQSEISGLVGYGNVTIDSCYSLGKIFNYTVSPADYSNYISGFISGSRGKVHNSVSLMESINGNRPDPSDRRTYNRVFNIYAEGTNNLAYKDMEGPDLYEIPWTAKGLNDRDGEDITLEQINEDLTIGGRFLPENGWKGSHLYQFNENTLLRLPYFSNDPLPDYPKELSTIEITKLAASPNPALDFQTLLSWEVNDFKIRGTFEASSLSVIRSPDSKITLTWNIENADILSLGMKYARDVSWVVKNKFSSNEKELAVESLGSYTVSMVGDMEVILTCINSQGDFETFYLFLECDVQHVGHWYLDNLWGDYYIGSSEELAEFAQIVNGTFSNNGTTIRDSFGGPNRAVYLMKDLDLNAYTLNGGWIPIGNSISPFQGGFTGESLALYDGERKTNNFVIIRNLFIDRAFDYQGLFGYASGGSLHRLRIIDAYVSGNDGVGILCGHGSDVQFTGIYINGEVYANGSCGLAMGYWRQNINSYIWLGHNFVEGRVTSTLMSTTNGAAGGLIGTLQGTVATYYRGNLDSTLVNAEVTGYQAGGLIGYSYGGFDIGSNTSNVIFGKVKGSYAAGGVVGRSITGFDTIRNNWALLDLIDASGANPDNVGRITGQSTLANLTGGNRAYVDTVNNLGEKYLGGLYTNYNGLDVSISDVLSPPEHIYLIIGTNPIEFTLNGTPVVINWVHERIV